MPATRGQGLGVSPAAGPRTRRPGVPGRYRDEVVGEPRGRTWELRAAVILVWLAATLVGLAVAATTRIGPILFSFSSSHGMHLGDLLAFAASYTAALGITLVLLRGR